MLTRRLQILLDADRYERVERMARESHRSVASLVRDAIDRAYPPDADERRRAADAILAAEPMQVPATVDELKHELADAHSRGR